MWNILYLYRCTEGWNIVSWSSFIQESCESILGWNWNKLNVKIFSIKYLYPSFWVWFELYNCLPGGMQTITKPRPAFEIINLETSTQCQTAERGPGGCIGKLMWGQIQRPVPRIFWQKVVSGCTGHPSSSDYIGQSLWDPWTPAPR